MPFRKLAPTKRNVLLIGIVLCLVIGIPLGAWWWHRTQAPSTEEQAALSPAAAFISDVYHTIQDNYWQQLSDEQLSQLFVRAYSQTFGTQPELTDKTFAGLTKLTDTLVKNGTDAETEQRLAQSVDVVLSSLQPAGRSRLYSQTQTTELENRVANRDTTTDLFNVLDVDQQASDSAIAAALQTKKTEVEKTATSEAQKQQALAELDRAYQALGTEANRDRYQETQVEPTIASSVLPGNTLYIKLSKFSPTTVADLQQVFQKYQGQQLGPGLVLDLRGNVGGAIDGLPYFLAPFLGNNQYAYQFFSQGKTFDFKTIGEKFAWLASFPRMVVLIDGETQSSAEVLAATLKKYHVGVLVGTASKGWGTVERVFPLEHQLSDTTTYSVFLVHSLTLDDTGNTIQGVGVQPDVRTTDANWQRQLERYYADQTLADSVTQVLTQPAQ